jgi:hypothetical protein
LATARDQERITTMSASAPPLDYTDVEIRSYLPSGWGIVEPPVRSWNERKGTWSIAIYDGADNVWPLPVAADVAARDGRLPALASAIDRLYRKALGRKSVITG